MIVLQTFRKGSVLLPGFDELVRSVSKLLRMHRKWSIYRWSAYLGKFYANFNQILSIWWTSIKQIRVLVAFILQPEMKLPKIVPDPDPMDANSGYATFGVRHFWCNTIKQMRVFVGLILEPEMELLENRPRPP